MSATEPSAEDVARAMEMASREIRLGHALAVVLGSRSEGGAIHYEDSDTAQTQLAMLRSWLAGVLCAALAAARAEGFEAGRVAEREDCAAVVLRVYHDENYDTPNRALDECMRLIRARGAKEATNG